MARLHGGGGAGGWSSGDIKIHNGTVASIPLGWVLCDGQNGTPNLVDRALVGAGGAYQHGEEFGADSYQPSKPSVSIGSHTLSTSQMPSHGHPVKFSNASSGYGDSRYGGDANNALTKTSQNVGGSSAHSHSVSVGNVGSVDTRQKSTAVIWIMKL